MKPVETIDVVAQVNYSKLAAADRPALGRNSLLRAHGRSVRRNTEHRSSSRATVLRSLLRGTRRSSAVTSWSPRSPRVPRTGRWHLPTISLMRGFGTTEFHVFRPSERITGPYLFNLLRAPYVRKAGAMKMKGAAGQRRVPADFKRSRSPSRPSTSRSGLRGFWMRRTPCGPSAARPSPSSTPSSNPPSSTCSATPSPIPWGPQRNRPLASARAVRLRAGPFGSRLKEEISVLPKGARNRQRVPRFRDDSRSTAQKSEDCGATPRKPTILTHSMHYMSADAQWFRTAHSVNHNQPLKVTLDPERRTVMHAYLLGHLKPCSQGSEHEVQKQWSCLNRWASRPFRFVPPLDLQRRFAAIVESVEQQRAASAPTSPNWTPSSPPCNPAPSEEISEPLWKSLKTSRS